MYFGKDGQILWDLDALEGLIYVSRETVETNLLDLDSALFDVDKCDKTGWNLIPEERELLGKKVDKNMIYTGFLDEVKTWRNDHFNNVFFILNFSKQRILLTTEKK